MTLQRRDVLFAGAGLAMAKVLATATACAGQNQGSGAPAATAAAPATQPANRQLASAAGACVTAGETCIQHCLSKLSAGDTSLAGCATAVHDMLAVCVATQRLAATDSAQLRAQAAVCVATCEHCASECEKHAKHHSECNDCFEACKATIALAKQVA